MADVVLGLGGNYHEVRELIALANARRRPKYDSMTTEVEGVSNTNRDNYFTNELDAVATANARVRSGL